MLRRVTGAFANSTFLTKSSGYGAAGLALALMGCTAAGQPGASQPGAGSPDVAAKNDTQSKATPSEVGHQAEQGSVTGAAARWLKPGIPAPILRFWYGRPLSERSQGGLRWLYEVMIRKACRPIFLPGLTETCLEPEVRAGMW